MEESQPGSQPGKLSQRNYIECGTFTLVAPQWEATFDLAGTDVSPLRLAKPPPPLLSPLSFFLLHSDISIPAPSRSLFLSLSFRRAFCLSRALALAFSSSSYSGFLAFLLRNDQYAQHTGHYFYRFPPF